MKSIQSRRGAIGQGQHRTSTIEGLEPRQLLSASPVTLKAVTPRTIDAGGSGTEVVVVRNLTATAVSEPVTITLAPSLDGVTAAGTYSSGGVSETVSLRKHGSAAIRVPFTPDNTLAGGKYHTLATVTLGTQTITAAAPGVYTYIAPTTSPSLIGEFSGLIISYKSTSTSTGTFGTGSKTHTTIHDLSFRWDDAGQDIDSVTGTYSVGDQQETGTMTGAELSNGKFSYTFSSALINYTVTGKVAETAKGETLSGLFKGTLVNNLFSTLNGHFKLTAGSVY